MFIYLLTPNQNQVLIILTKGLSLHHMCIWLKQHFCPLLILKVQEERKRRNGDKETFIETNPHCNLTPKKAYILSTDITDGYRISPTVIISISHKEITTLDFSLWPQYLHTSCKIVDSDSGFLCSRQQNFWISSPMKTTSPHFSCSCWLLLKSLISFWKKMAALKINGRDVSGFQVTEMLS